MAKQIKKEEVYESDLLIPLIKQGQELLKVLDANAKAMSEFAKEQAKVAKNADSNSAKGIKNLEQATKKLSATQKEKLKIDKQREQLRAKLNVANSEAIQKNEQLKVQLSEQRKVNKQLAREELNLVGAYEKQSKKLNELRKQYKNVALEKGKTSKEAKKLAKEVNKLDEELKDIDASVGQFQRNVGNYASAFDRLGASWKSLIKIGSGFGAALGLTGVISEVSQVEEEFRNLELQAKRTSGETGEALDELVVKTKALADTFGEDSNALLQAQNVLIKEFGVEADKAFNIVKTGLQSSANAQGDLLDNIREYSTQIRESGGSATDLLNILNTAGQEGIFSDKGVDVVKEFGLRIREQTKATKEALEGAFGKGFTDNLLEGVRSGTISSIDAIKLVSKELSGLEDQALKQTVIADVFGGPGEDAGSRFIEQLQFAGDEIDDLVDKNDPLIKQQEEQLELNEELAEAQKELADAARGTSQNLKRVVTQAKIKFYKALAVVVKFVADNFDTIVSVLKVAIRTFVVFKGTILLTNKVLKPLGGFLSTAVQGLKGFAAGTKGATSAFKTFNAALKANIIPLLITGIVELVNYLRIFEDDLERVAQNTVKTINLVKGLQEDQQAADRKYIDGRNKALQEQITLLEQKAELEIAKEPNRRKEIELKLQKDINKALNQEFVELNKLKALQDSRIRNRNTEIEQNEREIEALKVRRSLLKSQIGNVGFNPQDILKVQKEIDELVFKNVNLNRENIQFETIRKDLSGQISVILKRQEDVNRGITIEKLTQLNFDKERRSIQKEELNDYQQAKKDLQELIKLRQDLIKEEGGILSIEDEAKFQELTNKIERLKQQIENADVFLDLEELTKAEIIPAEQLENAPSLIGEEVVEKTAEDAEEIEDIYSQLADAIVGLFDTISDIIEKQLDRQIQKQEEFIQASQRRQDFLRQQAAEGNQIAKDSLAAEEAREAAALAKKQQAERRKRQLESANVILESISNLVGQGKSIGEATSISVASFQAVRALLSNLPAFLDGTEDTGKNGKGLDGKGGFMSILHPNERVMTKEQNAMVGGMSNWELAELAQNYNNGVLTPNIQAESVVQAYSNAKLISEVRDLKKAVVEKPVTNIEMGKIMQSFIELHERTIKGRKTTTKTHRLR